MERVFLLGGYDLEMVEIKNMLESRGKMVIDKKLPWGAKLSDYKEEIEKYPNLTIIGIELDKDMDMPINYISIDHHNDNSDKLSSIEQIAELLRIKLNRYQKLVAINDRCYIKGLIGFGANTDEINEIRKKDRIAQGITEEDERLAEESISNHMEIKMGVAIVHGLTSKFATITDRLYTYEKIIVYTDMEINYYGSFAEQQGKQYVGKYGSAHVYYGGGKDGFFGFVAGYLNKSQIEQIIDDIIKFVSIKSSHMFLFPFKWDFIKNKSQYVKRKSSFEEKVSLHEICKVLKRCEWDQDSDEIESAQDYNEKVYFYKNVRKAMYQCSTEKDPSVYNFTYARNKSNKGIYRINLLEGKSYDLEIEDIRIKVYETGVGILSFHLLNNQYDKKEDVLKINDYGRRIYPQFLNEENNKNLTNKVKQQFLANELLILWEDGKDGIKENFHTYENLTKVKENFTKLPNIIMELLGGKAYNKYFIDNTKELETKKILITPIIDDRMFVICWYMNNDCTLQLQKFNKKQQQYSYNMDELWLKYIFIDGTYKSCSSQTMTQDLLKKHTYDRWIENGTLYGMSKYSFMLLTSEDDFCHDVLRIHTEKMYYQIAALILAQRASILRFSDEISSIASLDDGNLVSRVRLLHKHYIRFVNKMYFREVTAQEQGIELYSQLSNICEIERNIKDLDNEISELHEYATLEQNAHTGIILHWLTVIGALFIVPTFFNGFFGMGILGDTPISFFGVAKSSRKWFEVASVWKWLMYFYSIPAAIIIGLYVMSMQKKIKIPILIIKSVLVIVIVALIILPIILNYIIQ